MIYTSTELFNAFAEDTRQIMVRVKINGAVFDNDNISTLNLEYGSMDGANFSLGSTFASSLKITFAELVEGLAELDEIEVEMGAVLPNGTVEYVPMGTFVINEEVMMDRNNNTTSIDALDRMVMLGNIYEPTLPGETARIIDIAVDIANQAGVVVSSDFDRLRTDSIQIPREKTLREAIGIIAQFEVGFATFNRDGELAIRKLNDPSFNITPEDYTMKGLVKNEVPFRLNGIQCQIGDGEDDVLQAGTSTGNQIILNNPSMTQEHLDRIYTELNSLNYYPFTLDWYGHPALEAGDWIEIEDLQGNKFKTPNLHYTLDFNGGLKAKSQAETTSSSEVVYQYKSPLKQEIQAIAARLSASGGNHVYDDLTEPENPKEGDLWFKPEGPDTLILKYTRLEDGTLDWVEELNTGDTTKNADAIAAQQQEIEDAKQQAKLDAEQALADAKAHADAEVERINTELSTDIDGAIDLAEQAKQDAIDKANQAFEDAITHAEAEDARIKQEIGLEVEGAIEIAEQAKADAVTKANQALADAKAHADSEILQFSEHFDGVLAEVESDVVDAQATADSAVEQIDTAVTNAGFTSLDETIGSINTITMNAEQNAQQAITDASNAHDLAQSSISEAQTAQANSLTALSEAEDALAGVSNLGIRVDDVEAELELKADNTFLTEDNEVITLSNAITLNAHRFSSDMSRIESRVESLVGEINLVVLRGAIEGTRLIGGEVFPNASESTATIDNNTMAEMIDVEAGEQLALSKESTDNDNFWRINFYLNNNYVSRITTGDNQHILTIPSGVNRMWVSYPKGSKPQIVRGTEFLPYRPNIADQMTTNEMVIFRNEYDEYADRTERRLSAIDDTGGSLDILENKIVTTANSIRTDMTAYIETKVDSNEFAEFYQNEYLETAQEVSRKISLTDVKIGGRNLLAKSGEGYAEDYSVGASTPGNPPSYTIREYDAISNHIDVTNEGVEDYYTFSKQDSLITDDEWFRIYWISKNGGVIRRDTSNENVFTTKKPENAVTLRFSFPKDSMAKVEKGNIATGYSEAFEDTDAKIGHVQTEWTQAHNMFKQTVSDDFGLVNDNVQTLENSLSAITNPVSGRLSIVEQVADGLQDTVMDTTTGLSATRTQMAEGFSQMVSSNFIRKRNFENGMTGNWGGQGNIENLSSLGPINGMTKAFKWATRNAFEEGNVFDVSPGETYYVEFVVNTFYAKYPVRFGLNTYGPLGENVGFNVMIEVPSGQPTQKVTGTITIPTTGANTPYTKARPLLQINGPNGSDLGHAYATALAISPNANNSQITQLENNINLRVKEGDVVSQINIEAEQTLIQSNRLVLDANSVVFTGSAFIPSAQIESLHASKINAGTINSERINATEIVTQGLTTNVVKSTHLETNTATIDKLFANETMINQLTSKTAFIDSIKAVEIDAGKITSGTIDTARLNAKLIVSEGLEVDVIEAEHIKADTAIIEKLFATKANIDILTAKEAFINSIKAVDIDAARITTGTIKTARLNATDIVTEGLEADVIKSTHILADVALFDKLFTSDLATDRLSAQEAWIKNINIADASIDGAKIQDATIGSAQIAELDAAKITTGTLDAGQITVVNLDANSITSNKTTFVQSAWNTATGGTVSMGSTGLSSSSYNGGSNLSGGEFRIWDDSHTLIAGAGRLDFYSTANAPSGHSSRTYSFVPSASLGPSGNVIAHGLSIVAVNKSAPSFLDFLTYGTIGFTTDEVDFIIWDETQTSAIKVATFTTWGLRMYEQINMNDNNLTGINSLIFNNTPGTSGNQIYGSSAGDLNLRSVTGNIVFEVYNYEKMRITSGGVRMESTLNMNSNDIINQSDERLKTNIKVHESSSLEKISQFNFVDWNWSESHKEDFGVIAQQVQEVAPELVSVGDDGYLNVNNSRLNIMTTHAISEMDQKVDNLNERTEEKIHKLQQELSKANRRIEELEGVM